MPSTSLYFDIRLDPTGRKFMAVNLRGLAVLRIAMINKGTAFSPEERQQLGLDGLLPPQVTTLEQQLDRVYRGFRREPTAIAQYQYLRALHDRNEILFFALVERHLSEMLPIVYTPTVGEAVQSFNDLYQSARGLSLSPLTIDRAAEVVSNYPWNEVRMIVATDSSAILGIGDQGYGGLAISIGKMAIYTAGGGVNPYQTMPVGLDVGTDRQDLHDNPAYLGVRKPRLRGEAYFAFFDRFVDAVKTKFPKAIVQWEDLAKEAAFSILDRYRQSLPSFNDDIQGTGAVALAGLVSACTLKNEALRDQRVVISGAGAGGIGVASAMVEGMIRDGLSRDDAHARVFVLDSRGLLTDDRKMEAYKRPFAQKRTNLGHWVSKNDYPDLLETIQNARATTLLGLSGQPGTFDETVVLAMAATTPRPIIFPLSNPTSACEGSPEDILWWTQGKAIVATGSPFGPVHLDGKTLQIGQGNNAFIFPGLGFGTILAEARTITDAMVLAAAYALAEYTAEKYLAEGLIYPPVSDLQEVSKRVATRVVQQAIDDGVATASGLDRTNADRIVRERFWHAHYVPARLA